MEWKLFDGDEAEVSTYAFHEHRERAPHLEQPIHRPRLEAAANLVKIAANLGAKTLSDLGCGDGGLLQLTADVVEGWGYDFAPANAAGWDERNVNAEALDVFGADRDKIVFGDITAVTEVLEHLSRPHAAVKWIGEHSRFIVASSPWDENDERRDPCHSWAFDVDGYRYLIESGGYRVLRHQQVSRFQVVLGWRPT
jgi:hypothetical protein